MVISKTTTVDDYIDEAPAERRAGLAMLRELCRQHLPGYDESMQYGMPTYGRAGTPEVAFASQAKYFSLYVLKKPVVDAHRDQIAGLELKVGKGCIRFPSAARIEPALVQSLLECTVKTDAEICE